jgi:hypothetical protein
MAWTTAEPGSAAPGGLRSGQTPLALRTPPGTVHSPAGVNGVDAAARREDQPLPALRRGGVRRGRGQAPSYQSATLPSVS